MKKKKQTQQKTNAMRILDQECARYEVHEYSSSIAVNGMEVAVTLGKNPDSTFKTLVTEGHSKLNGREIIKEHYVFMIPVSGELNLKKAAGVVGEKSIEMIKQKELLMLTGYVHGGCSPIGMKKQFRTIIDESAENFETIMFSAGKIGLQVELPLSELSKALEFELADIK